MTVLYRLVCGAAFLWISGCATTEETRREVDMRPAAPESCELACSHASNLEERARLARLEDFEPAVRPKQRAKILAKTPQLAELCSDVCKRRGTRAQTACIQVATNLQELASCTKLPKRKPAP